MSVITQLEMENIKKIRAFRVTPTGALMLITGRNGQGKSSVLDAIEMALGGKDHICAEPVRRGAENGHVVCEIGDLIIKRTFKSDGTTNLTVSNKDGARYSKPQNMLDDLVGKITFDPLAFAKAQPKDQLDTLRRLVGLDFAGIEGRRLTAFEERTSLNRQLKQLEGQIAGMPLHADVPADEIDIKPLQEKRQEAFNQFRINDAVRNSINEADHFLKVAEQREREGNVRILELERELEAARMSQAVLKEKTIDAVNRVVAAKTKIEALVDPDVKALDADIESAILTNKKVDNNRRRAGIQSQADNLKAQSNELTATLEALDEEKRDMLQATKFPVAGLSLSDAGVLFNEIPFQQASGAEQLRVSIAIGLAMNPKLKTLLVRDGSLLDADGLALVAQMAEEAGAQVWVERVSNGEKVGVVIEDGEMVSESQEPVEAAAE